MKLLECCDAGLVEALRREGHDVTYILEMRPGATDTEVLQQARRDERILLTVDKDFGELVYRLRRPVPGLVLLRFVPEEQTPSPTSDPSLWSRPRPSLKTRTSTWNGPKGDHGSLPDESRKLRTRLPSSRTPRRLAFARPPQSPRPPVGFSSEKSSPSRM